jgi:mRNA interferase MazF
MIPFPYSDMSAAKRRPVLALTSPDHHGDFICLAITSVPTPEHAIQIGDASLVQGALPKTSWVRVDKIFTLESSRIRKVFGSVQPQVLKQVLDALCARVGYSAE